VNPKIEIIKNSTEDELKDVYSDKYIISSFCDYDIKEPIIDKSIVYYSAYVNNDFVGCFVEVMKSPFDSELHSLLKKKALRYSRKLALSFINMIFQSRNVFRVSTTVIHSLKTVINFCIKIGFVIDGLKQNANIKNGQIQNVLQFRILRGELWVE
jgi:hypothetical protein